MENVFIVFEAINHALKVIEEASKHYKVIVYHSLEYDEAPPYGHLYKLIWKSYDIKCWNDYDEIQKQVIQDCDSYCIKGTYAAAEITLPLNSLIRSHYNLPCLDFDRVKFMLNKKKVRDMLYEKKASNVKTFTENELRTHKVNLPCFVKPINGAGSAYVKRCTSNKDVDEILQRWNKRDEVKLPILVDYLELSNNLFAEEEISGELMSLEGWCYEGKYYPIGLLSRTVLARDPAVEMGSVFPYEHKLYDEIVEKITKIHQLFGINHGPTHSELIIDNNGNIELVELNIRFVGADVLMQINLAADFRMEELLFELSCGRKPNLLPKDINNYSCLQYVLAPNGLKEFKSISFPEKSIVFKKVMHKSDTLLEQTDSQMDHLGGFIVTDVDYTNCLEKAMIVRSSIKVNNQLLGDNPNNVIQYW